MEKDKLLHKRHPIELRLDRWNHVMELIRTIAGIISATGGFLAMLRIFGII